MLIISREQTESNTTCIIQLEDGESYNQDALLNVCSHRSKIRHSSYIDNFPEQRGLYKVYVQTGHEAYDNIFAEMVKEYGKA